MEKTLGGNNYVVKLQEDHEEVITHDEIIAALNKNFEDGCQHCMFKDIIGQRKIRDKETRCYECQIKVLWDNDDVTWKPVWMMKKDDPWTAKI